MAAEILLEINGHKYNASGFSYDFYQVPDFKGKSVTGIKGGDIHVVLDSSYDNSILETMLSDKTRKVPCVPWEEYEPCPVSGRIQFVQDDVHVFCELAFEEAYITRYKEKMDANGYPMSILLTISTLRLDINRFVRMDRRPETTYGLGWVKYIDKRESSIILQTKPSVSARIIDAYWIKEDGSKCKIFPIGIKVCLFLVLADFNSIIGEKFDFLFEEKTGEEIYTASYSKIITDNGLIKIENFEFKRKN